ncbi:hypothetical protein NKH35_13500 [Mesorhizobium sp. M1143]
MLGVNDIGPFDDLGNPIDDMMPAPTHSIGHVAQSGSQQHGLMAGVAKPVGQQFDDRFRSAVSRQGEIGDKNSQRAIPCLRTTSDMREKGA